MRHVACKWGTCEWGTSLHMNETRLWMRHIFIWMKHVYKWGMSHTWGIHEWGTLLPARPNVWFMFTAWLTDFRKSFYLSFSTNMKNPFRRIKGLKRKRSCVTGFITQHSWVVHFLLIDMISKECCVWALYQFPRGLSAGLALKYFCMIHKGGRI